MTEPCVARYFVATALHYEVAVQQGSITHAFDLNNLGGPPERVAAETASSESVTSGLRGGAVSRDTYAHGSLTRRPNSKVKNTTGPSLAGEHRSAGEA